MVLLDLSLPDSHGLESLERLKQFSDDVPIIVLTGLDDEETAIQALKQGAQDYAIKGKINGDGLARSIRYSMERHRLLSELDRAHKREKELLERRFETRFRNLIENNPDGVLVLSISGTVLFANTAATEILERELDELPGNKFGFPVTVGKSERIEISAQGQETKLAETRVVETEWGGEFAYLVTLRDITEQKLVRDMIEDLEEENAHLKTTSKPSRVPETDSPTRGLFDKATRLIRK